MPTVWSDAERTQIRDAFQNWAADEWPNSARKAHEAAAAAERAYLNGDSRELAVEQGRRAAARMPETQGRPPIATAGAPKQRPSTPAARPGCLRARVLSVSRQSLLGGPRAMVLLDVRAATEHDNTLIDVQMSGVYLDGVVAQGDIIDIPLHGSSTGLVKPSEIYNVSTNAPVRMLRGIRGVFRRQVTEWGIRQTMIGLVAVPVTLLILISVVIGGAFVIHAFSDTNRSSQQARQGSASQTSAGMVAVPNVTNLGNVEAATRLGDAGLQPSGDFERSTTVPFGKVIRTDPPAGTQVPSGSRVFFYIATK